MRRRIIGGTSLAALALVTTGAAAAGDDGGRDIYLLTRNRSLVTVDSGDLSRHEQRIDGLARGDRLVGIDVRPLDGVLYGIARSSAGTNLYAIDVDNGDATLVADLVDTADGTPIVLDSGFVGIDFNPAADALRIVTSTGQNLRALPSDRVVSGTPRFTGDTFVDLDLNEAGSPATGVAAAAYTQNDNDAATATALYDIDVQRDRVVAQDPPNDGTLTTVGTNLQRRTDGPVGFDIFTEAGVDTAWAVLRQPGSGVVRLHVVDLTTGAVIQTVAQLPSSTVDLAIEP